MSNYRNTARIISLLGIPDGAVAVIPSGTPAFLDGGLSVLHPA